MVNCYVLHVEAEVWCTNKFIIHIMVYTKPYNIDVQVAMDMEH